jgi:hypothetical protein
MKRPVKSRRGDDGRHSIYVLASTHAPSDKPTPFCLGQSASEPITQRRRRGNDAPKSVALIIKSLRQGFPSPSSPLIHAYHSTKQCAQRPFCASSPLITPLAPLRGNTLLFCCRPDNRQDGDGHTASRGSGSERCGRSVARTKDVVCRVW